MGLHRLGGEIEPHPDLLVGEAPGDVAEHLALARGELAERVAAAGEQLGDDFGVERAAARRHPV